MSNLDPSKVFFDQLKEAVQHISSVLSDWQKKEGSIHTLAEQNAKSSGMQEGPGFDAHVYAHKVALKKAMADHAKQAQDQGAPGLPAGMPDLSQLTPPPGPGGMPPGLPPGLMGGGQMPPPMGQ